MKADFAYDTEADVCRCLAGGAQKYRYTIKKRRSGGSALLDQRLSGLPSQGALLPAYSAALSFHELPRSSEIHLAREPAMTLNLKVVPSTQPSHYLARSTPEQQSIKATRTREQQPLVDRSLARRWCIHVIRFVFGHGAEELHAEVAFAAGRSAASSLRNRSSLISSNR